jgi:hypothetical protein
MATALVRDLDDAVYERLKARGRQQPFAGGRITRDPGARFEAGQYRHGEGGRRCDATAAGGPFSKRQWGNLGSGTLSVTDPARPAMPPYQLQRRHKCDGEYFACHERFATA